MHLQTKITKINSFLYSTEQFFTMSDKFSQPYTFDRVVRLVLTALFFVALFFMVKYLSSVLLPFFIAWLFAYMFQPLVDWINRFVKSRKVSILIVMASILATVALLICYMVPTFISEFFKLKDLLVSTGNMNRSIVPQEWVDYISQVFGDTDMTDKFTPSGIFDLAVSLFPHLGQLLSNSVSVLILLVESIFVLIYLYFILRDQDAIALGFVKLLPQHYKGVSISLMRDLKQGMNLYYRRQAIIAILDAVMFSLGFSLIGMPMSIVMGVTLGVLNMVPYLQYLGLPPAAILMLIKATESNSSIGVALLLLLAVFVFVQIVQDLYLIPKIMGKSMGLNPAVLLLSLSVWGYMLGIIGMIIALPVTTIFISYYKHYFLNESFQHPFDKESERE